MSKIGRNQFPLTDKNRLSVVNPEFSKEWNYEKNYPLMPEEIGYSSNKSVWWKCKNGHEWCISPNSRQGKKHGKPSGCPYCSGRYACKDNCLATNNLELAKEWHPTKNGKLTPYDVTCGSDKKVWWICKKGHEWMATIKERNGRKSGRKDGCVYCSKNSTMTTSDNCLGSLMPELSKEWHPTKNANVTPFDVRANSNKKVWWLCPRCKNEWTASPNNRNNAHNGCPFCTKICLDDGTSWDSYIEAYVYLKFKSRGMNIVPHKAYGWGKRKCDFYLPQYNAYYEITCFGESNGMRVLNFWQTYMSKIRKKEKFVEKILGANFRFVHLRSLNRSQKMQVTRRMKNNA